MKLDDVVGFRAMTRPSYTYAVIRYLEGAMQTSGTFPQLNRTDAVTRRPAPKKAGKKR